MLVIYSLKKTILNIIFLYSILVHKVGIMRKYELITVFDPADSFDDHKNFVNETFNANNFKIFEEKDMGEFDLAQPISERKRAHYYFYNLEADQKDFPEVERAFRLHKGLIRYMFVKKSK